MSESESQKWWTGVQDLITRLDGLEERFNSLETRIDERFEESERQRDDRFKSIEKHIDVQFEQVNNRLEKIDESLRGNGRDGLNTRLNHAEKMQTFFLWVGGISLTGFFGILAVFVAKYLDLVDQLRNSV